MALAQQRMAINQDIKGLVPNKDLVAEYLMWFLLNRTPDIEKMGLIVLSRQKGGRPP